MKYSLFLYIVIFISIKVDADPVIIDGELKKWHKITLTFNGPSSSENDPENPFLNYRLDVTFSHGDASYKVPGFFAADGNAANTSATSGNKWQVYFAPDRIGEWNYKVSFRKGDNIAINENPDAGESAGFMDGMVGEFTVQETDKSGRDHRAKGRLQYVGGHYLQFAGTGQYFLKAGADSPENFLAYKDIDGEFKNDGIKDDLVKTWDPHLKDWKKGDPSWQKDKGKAIIGALNYLSSQGLNAFSFITMNIEGDDCNVYPYTSYDERYRFDISKLAQWEIIFEHADKLGLFMHFKTQEAENQGLLDGGNLGIQRKLYYRELIARFSHHLALNWNLGEENGTWMTEHPTPPQNELQRRAMADYFAKHDPYQHHIVIHNGEYFNDLLGDSALTGVSVQTHLRDFKLVHSQVLDWRQRSSEAGKPWVITLDEPGDAEWALVPDNIDPDHDNARYNVLWATYMAGGAGVEWYFGYKEAHSDLTCEDWRSRENMWKQSEIALDFFRENEIPFWRMRPADHLVLTPGNFGFVSDDEIYIFYLKTGDNYWLNLENINSSYTIKWFDPENNLYYDWQSGQHKGKTWNVIPPTRKVKDWILMITCDLKL